jgi:hypothetical protein
MNWRRHNRPNYRPWLRQPVTFGKAVIPHIDFQDSVPRRFLPAARECSDLPAARECSDWGLAASAIGPLFSLLTITASYLECICQECMRGRATRWCVCRPNRRSSTRLRPHRLPSIVSIEAAMTRRARHIVSDPSDPVNLLAVLV